MSTKRCFLGLRIPAFHKYKQYLDELDNNHAIELKIVDPELYHFTLHFFGDLQQDEINDVITNLSSVSFEPFKMRLGESGYIPHNKPHKVRVLYVNPAEGTSELQRIQGEISKILKSNGYEVSNRQFLPHLTVARVKYGKDKSTVAKKWEGNPIPADDPFEIKAFQLIHSELTSKGPIYSDIHTFPL